MSTRYYPLYRRGNPQLRIFLPNFWMKLVKPEEPLPPNVVLFQTSIQMTQYDVKNYLEKIYKVPVVDVKTTIKMGKMFIGYPRKCVTKEDDYKEALVYLPRDYKFEFPNIENPTAKEQMKSYRELKRLYLEGLKTEVPYFPKWFAK